MTTTTQAAASAALRWAAEAKAKLAAGKLTASDIDKLTAMLSNPPRQRLLVMHATEPNLFAGIVACNIIEPTDDYEPNLEPRGEFDWPYPSVFDALKDGWQVIHFPLLSDTVRDDEQDVNALGFEFILQKIEVLP